MVLLLPLTRRTHSGGSRRQTVQRCTTQLDMIILQYILKFGVHLNLIKLHKFCSSVRYPQLFEQAAS